MQELIISMRRYQRGLSNLSVLALFGTVNLILAITNASFYLVFSPVLPTLAYQYGAAFTMATGRRGALTAGIFFALCLLSVWFYLRKRANGNSRMMMAATLYYALDTVVLTVFSLRYSYSTGIVDIFFHLMALGSLIGAVRAGRIIDSSPAPTTEAVEDILLAMAPPPEGLAPGTEVGDVAPDAEDSTPLRDAVERKKYFFDCTLFGLGIRVARSRALTELCINGKVYAEERGVYELIYSLSATVDGHRVTVRLAPGRFYGRMILLVDGRLVADRRRYF